MEPRNVRFHPQAEQEAQRAFRWYRERNPAAAQAFLVDLDHAVLRVAETPERWPHYRGTGATSFSSSLAVASTGSRTMP